MGRGPWYRLLETLLFAFPPVIGVGIVGVLQSYPDPLVGRAILAVASVGGLAIRIGVPVCLFLDGRALRERGLWRSNYSLYALGALLLSAPAVGLFYLYRRHDRVGVPPGWDGWWAVVAASLGGSLSGIPVALLAYVLALPPLVVAIPAVLAGLALAVFPVGIYRDAIYLRTAADWRPNPALYLALAFASLFVPLLQPPVAAYYLYRRQATLPARIYGCDKRAADASTVSKPDPGVVGDAMAHNFTEDDEGKTVVNDQGDEVGIIADVEHGTAYVDPDPGLTDKIKSKLGWDDRDEETYPLQSESVASVDNGEVRLGSATTTGTGTTTGTTAGSGANTPTGERDTTDDDGVLGDDDDGLLDDDDDTRR